MALTKLKSSGIADGAVTAAKIASGAVDTTSLRNDIATLALHSAIADNKAAYNLSNVFVDQYEDDTGIHVATTSQRNTASEYVSTDVVGGNDSYCKFLLSSDTTNGSTTFADTSVGGAHGAANQVSGAVHDTSQAKFGGSSAHFAGVSHFVKWAASADWQLTKTASWTIDFWMRVDAFTAPWARVMEQQDTSGAVNAWSIRFNGNASPYDRVYMNESQEGPTDANEMCGSQAGVPLDEWHHHAWVFNYSTLTLTYYLDGVATDSATTSHAQWDWTTSTTQEFALCRYGGGATHGFDGWLDEVRLSKGIARWTANFTPETSPYVAAGLNAAGNYTSINQTSSATVSKMGIVVLYKNATGTATLDTDLIVQVSADGGTNYVSAPLTAGGTFSTGINIAKSNSITISNTGTAPKYKISFANQATASKVTRVHGVALLY
jgi:hypothetical protein